MPETHLGTEPVYTLGSDEAERERLRRQSDELREHACAQLDRVGPLLGASVLDLGCGPSGTLELLSERVGPSGRVVGMDLNPVHVAQARELVQARGLANVEVLEGDATSTGLPSGDVRAEMWPAGHPRRAIMIDLVRAMRPKILERSLLPVGELDEIEREARAHLADAHTLTLPYLYFLAWARKPPA